MVRIFSFQQFLRTIQKWKNVNQYITIINPRTLRIFLVNSLHMLPEWATIGKNKLTLLTSEVFPVMNCFNMVSHGVFACKIFIAAINGAINTVAIVSFRVPCEVLWSRKLLIAFFALKSIPLGSILLTVSKF